MIELLVELLAAALEALAEFFLHSLRARSWGWWIPPVLLSVLFLGLAWVFRANANPAVPVAFLVLAMVPPAARALLMRRGGRGHAKPSA